MRIVFDIEANGLLLPENGKPEADKVWCIALKEVGAEKVEVYQEEDFYYAFKIMREATYLIGHNIIKYDIPLLKKLYKSFEHKSVLWDTMVVSYLLNPDRGGHSLEAWAEFLGDEKKVEQETWDTFDPNMLVRCASDVRITEKVYYYLMNEIEEDQKGDR